jgi:hypothetical protein
MAAFKTSTTPAVIKALEESKLQFDMAGARLAAVKGRQYEGGAYDLNHVPPRNE